MKSQTVRKAIDAPGVAARYRGKRCAIKGCNRRTLTATTEYCAIHFQQLVGKPRLKEWLKHMRASTRKRT